LSVPSKSGLCSFTAASDDAISQVSTSAGVVRIHSIALGWIAPTSEFGSVVGEEVIGSFAFLDLSYRRPVGPHAGNAGERRLSSIANQISPPSALSNSLNEVNVTTRRLPTPSGGDTRCGRSANEMASRSKLGTTTSGRRARRTYAHSTRSEKCLQVATRFRKRHSRAGNRAIVGPAYKLHLGERSNDLKRLPTASCRQCQTSALLFGRDLPALCFGSLLLVCRRGDTTGMMLALAFCQCRSVAFLTVF
jgi:hypothetical protein